jgi:hypothetical protein
MTQNDLAGWLLCERYKVEDAAILLAGGHPGKTELKPCPEREELVEVKLDLRMAKERGFLTALQSAIQSKTLPASVAYRCYAPSDEPQSYCVVKSGRIQSAYLDDVFSPPGEGDFDSWKDMLVIEKPIDWNETTVVRGDLLNWAASKGLGFPKHFPEDQVPIQGFQDPEGKHFAPELALAVVAWSAVSANDIGATSPKAAIREWLDRNEGAWKGHRPLTNDAKERISTLVNWNKSGGAPKRTV